jgi:replicative DNA helicase
MNVEHERCVLGAALLDKKNLIKVVEGLEEDVFHHPGHKDIFRLFKDMFDNDEHVDLVTVNRNVTDKKLSEDIDIVYVSSMLDGIPHNYNIDEYMGNLKKDLCKVQFLRLSKESENRVLSGDSIDEVIADHAIKVIEIGRATGLPRPKLINEGALELIKAMEAQGRSGKLPGVTSGFTDLDKITQGFRQQDLVVIAARPSLGKSSLCLNMALRSSGKGVKTLIISIEDTEDNIKRRMLSSESQIDYSKASAGFLSVENYKSLYKVLSTNRSVYLVDSVVYINDISMVIRKAVLEEEIDVVVVDYLQLIRSKKDFRSEVDELGYYTATLKGLAKELRIPIIAVSQLNRGTEHKSESVRPTLANLRGSGCIEQDADMVIFLYRDASILKDKDIQSLKTITTELVIAKHRNGPLGTIKVEFIPHQTRFENHASEFES